MSAAALDRQIRPIYDALDTGSNKSAIVACNKLLKKHPKNELLKALKALALIRSQKVEESLVLCDEVLESKPTHDAILTAMMHVLRGLGRHNDMVTMFDEAFKKQPQNEDLGCQTFFANVRAGNWKSAHQVANRMFKLFQEDRYLYWAIISAVLQAKDITTAPAMRPILYKLAHRLITSASTPSSVNADRFHLHLSILNELKLYDEAEQLLDSDVGKSICATNLSCDEVRREIWRQQGRSAQEGERAEKLILEKGDRNWLEFLAVLDAALPSTTSENSAEGATERVSHAATIFSQVAEKDGKRDRSGPLALVELEHRVRTHGLSKDSLELVKRLQAYFEAFGDKACCFEDLKPYLPLPENEASAWDSFLQTVPASIASVPELQRLINVLKLQRFSLPQSDIAIESEKSRLDTYLAHYFSALPLGSALPATELQYADDLALLASNALVNLWKLTQDTLYLFNLVYLLEFALTKSKQAFLARLLLIRVYRILGAPSLALEHYRAMNIKQVQHDTLSHLILSHASVFSLASTGDLTLATECLESTQIYLSNSQETGDFVVRAFNGEKYSQIPEFISFEEQLDNSLQRDAVKMEHLKMRLSHEAINPDIIDMELIELKFIFDRIHHDNRDFAILPNYQPKSSVGINEQTTLFGKTENQPWLSIFLKVYIRAFQQASDLDDTVEEKLLIGDRPKQHPDAGNRPPLHERLLERTSEEFESLTPEEARLVGFATVLADWLEPYHDYARPPPAVVLAEAAKQTELKTGHPLKGIEIPPSNGAANGHRKKDEEPPLIQDAPTDLISYLEGLKARFDAALAVGSPPEILQIAVSAQEAFLLLTVETWRFKNASVVKLNKLGNLVNYLKPLKALATKVVEEISEKLSKQADALGSATTNVSSILGQQIASDTVVSQNKKIADARKKVLDGVGKGLARLATAYA